MSKNSKLNVLGVMTGTSMDGVDISLIKTNGTDFVKIKCEKSYKFDKNYQNTINNLILNKPKTNNKITLYFSDIKRLAKYVSEANGKNVPRLRQKMNNEK